MTLKKPKKIKKPNFGSDIEYDFKTYHGSEKYIKYDWVAYSSPHKRETIFLCNPEYWQIKGSGKVMIRKLRRLLIHETIHNIINWERYGKHYGKYGNYDVLVKKFYDQIQRESPKTWKDWAVF